MKLCKGITLLSMAAVVALSGCSIVPEPIPMAERIQQEAMDHKLVFSEQDPVNGPVSLYEAMARAIRFNLDHRLKLMENALSQNQLDVSKFDMLPKMVATAGYTSRNKESLSISKSVKTGELTDASDSSISQDRGHETASLGLTWNLLDFGVSYFQGKQEADRFLVAKERRRKVIQNLLQEVRYAYWRAYGAQQLHKDVEKAMGDAESALADTRAAAKERLRDPLESLQYRKSMIEIMRQLENVRADMVMAHIELAKLMNVSPGVPYKLAPTNETDYMDRIDLPLEKMEHLALVNRPELIEEGYQARIGVLETRKAIARLFPGLEFSASQQHDGNFYLVNHQWADAGAKITWNLFNLFSAPARLRLAESQESVAETRRLSMHMAVLSQVHVAYHQLQTNKKQFERVDLLNDIEQEIRRKTANQKQNKAQSSLEYVRSATSAIMTRLRRTQAFAQYQQAVGRLYMTLGTDPLPETLSDHKLETVAQVLESTMDQWSKGGFSEVGEDLRLKMDSDLGTLIEPEVASVDMTSQPVDSEPTSQSEEIIIQTDSQEDMETDIETEDISDQPDTSLDTTMESQTGGVEKSVLESNEAVTLPQPVVQENPLDPPAMVSKDSRKAPAPPSETYRSFKSSLTSSKPPVTPRLASGYAVRVAVFDKAVTAMPLMDRLRKAGMDTYFRPVLKDKGGVLQTVVAGGFKKRRQAVELKEKIVEMGIKDAYVILLQNP